MRGGLPECAEYSSFIRTDYSKGRGRHRSLEITRGEKLLRSPASNTYPNAPAGGKTPNPRIRGLKDVDERCDTCLGKSAENGVGLFALPGVIASEAEQPM